MTPSDRELVSQLCATRVGVRVDPEKAYLIESRLAPVARRDGFGSVGDMLSMLRERREDKLAWSIVEAMVQSESAFFRDREPFALFRDEVLPALARQRGAEPVRIWSAACAAGQEVYSLAMIVEDERGRLPGLKVELFGTDIGERPTVVFCTVENSVERIREALDSGADEYIMKPFDGDIIAAKFAQVGLA